VKNKTTDNASGKRKGHAVSVNSHLLIIFHCTMRIGIFGIEKCGQVETFCVRSWNVMLTFPPLLCTSTSQKQNLRRPK
jgi:hypothetical protein